MPFSSKRHHSKETHEEFLESIGVKRGKKNGNIESFTIIERGDDESSSEPLSEGSVSFSEELQSIPSPVADKPNDIDDILGPVQLLSESISCLHEDAVLLHETVSNLNRKISEQQNQIDVLQKLVQQTIEINKNLQKRNRAIEEELESVKKEASRNSPLISPDGTYLWKITDFTQKLADAISDKQPSIYSPAFYSSPNGYKMCMRLYLNGDGQARRTHISLFFVMLRGENDAILPWPFTHRVTFSLFDQSPAKRHIVDSFRPDPKSNSFQRPRSSMSIASGIPKFLPINVVNQNNNPYVRDDCMFIRCAIDFDLTPKQFLSTLCTLNLGLSPTKRDKVIQEHIIKSNLKTTEKPEQEESTAEHERDRTLMEITTQS